VGTIDSGDELVLVPNKLVSMLDKELSLLSVLHLRKLQPDDVIAYNAHVSL
jgi:hypothetical protein